MQIGARTPAMIAWIIGPAAAAIFYYILNYDSGHCQQEKRQSAPSTATAPT
jgi:hypothetical protein